MSIIGDIIGDVVTELVGGVFDGVASAIRRRWGVAGCVACTLLVLGVIAGLIWLVFRLAG